MSGPTRQPGRQPNDRTTILYMKQIKRAALSVEFASCLAEQELSSNSIPRLENVCSKLKSHSDNVS